MPNTKYIVKNLLWAPVTVELKKGNLITLKSRETRTMELDEADLNSVGFRKILRERRVFVRTEAEKKPK